MITKSPMVQLKVISNPDLSTTQTPFEIGVMDMILNFTKIYVETERSWKNILKWSIAAYASPYRCGPRHCDLCKTEKYIIARADQKYLLNKCAEFPNVAIELNSS